MVACWAALVAVAAVAAAVPAATLFLERARLIFLSKERPLCRMPASRIVSPLLETTWEALAWVAQVEPAELEAMAVQLRAALQLLPV